MAEYRYPLGDEIKKVAENAINEVIKNKFVPVVRCKDCKYNNRCMLQEFVKSNSVRPFNENEFYCPDGKMMEKDTDEQDRKY